MVKEVRASHILVKSEDKAKEVLAKIKAGQSFEMLAMECSMCPSKKKGGDLGWFGRGRMVREFENLAFNLKKGELGITKTQFGWHVIKKVDEK
ncbi:peptidylprolyl isomerase [Candidatus Woesearchaeota archaeon]|nr:peptidylprolyl isomerase [Candidatus Woesearchaeota archaeon]